MAWWREQPGLAAFDGDALTAYRQKPLVCVLPRSKDEVCAILAFAAAHKRSHRAARRRHLAVGRRAAARRRHPARHGAHEADSRNRFRESLRRGGARRHQSHHHPRGRSAWLLLRARSVQPDRLHHRRQCRGEFRRAALPEIRPDHQQSAGRRDRAARWRAIVTRRQSAGRGRARSARPRRRLGRPAGRGGRSDGAHPAQAAGDPHPCWPRSAVPEAGRASPPSSPTASCRPRWNSWTSAASRRSRRIARPAIRSMPKAS